MWWFGVGAMVILLPVNVLFHRHSAARVGLAPDGLAREPAAQGAPMPPALPPIGASLGRRVRNMTMPFGENEFVIIKIDCTSYTSDEAIVPRTVVFLRSFHGEERHLDLHILLDPKEHWILLDVMTEI